MKDTEIRVLEDKEEANLESRRLAYKEKASKLPRLLKIFKVRNQIERPKLRPGSFFIDRNKCPKCEKRLNETDFRVNRRLVEEAGLIEVMSDKSHPDSAALNAMMNYLYIVKYLECSCGYEYVYTG